jgi:hypothetical protein
MQLLYDENGNFLTLPLMFAINPSSKALPRQLEKSYSSTDFTPNTTVKAGFPTLPTKMSKFSLYFVGNAGDPAVKFGSDADQPCFYFKR